MAMGKYSRVDGRRSSSNCVATTVVVVVGVCLVGAWMMMSSSVDFSITGQFEDKSGKLVEDSYKGDTIVDSVQENEKVSTKEFDNTNEKSYGDKTEKPESDDDGNSRKSESEQETEQVGVDKKGEDEAESKPSETDTESTNAEEKKNAEEEKGAGEEASSESKQETNEVESGSGSEESQDEETREKTVVVENVGETKSGDTGDDQNGTSDVEEKTEEDKSESSGKDQSELVKESSAQTGSFSTQSAKSENEKESHTSKTQGSYKWKTCNVTAGPDYIPCLDNHQAIKKLTSRSHYQHRERHCPEDPPTCLVSLPEGYRNPVKWPRSRAKIWFNNVPHTKLVEYKGHQNWVKVEGEYLTFPGGGTQFIHGALHYIDFIQQTLPDICWGKRTRVILDVGCGVASFGGFLFERDVLAMSLAPKDEHEAQVQFALERGIPAFSAVMGTKRLPFPSMVFDIVHCARCRVPWHLEGGKLLLELNRVLRPGGYFVWSATPVYQKIPEDVAIWKAMSKLTKSMCWELVKIGRDKLNGVAAAVYRKPTSNDCYMDRPQNVPPLCEESDDPNAAWNVPLQACMHKVPVDASVRGSQWPPSWPLRLKKPPYWLKSSDVGVYGKSAPKDFSEDYEHWKHVAANSYMKGMGIDWSAVRNVMDMRALYGGFAAALKDLKVWVMNVVPIDSPDTLPIIYERGLFGMYHDWCESFSTYPRTYDLLHADHILSSLKKRCNIVAVIAEVDRILRPGGYLILRDKAEIISEVENMAKSLHWKIQLLYSEGKEGMLCVQKTKWRPEEVETLKYAIA